jgi:carbohydrate kinase (thermoresistant glucokinase family)
MTGRNVARNTPRNIVVMGVSGCGKTTVGALIAKCLGAEFLDGDSLHPAENVAEMAAGAPLTDEDRRSWLAEIGKRFAAADTALVVACSALKRAHRDIIRDADPSVVFVHLHGTRELLYERMNSRPGHCIPSLLLDSQLVSLELLQNDEDGTAVDAARSIGEVVFETKNWIRSRLLNA